MTKLGMSNSGLLLSWPLRLFQDYVLESHLPRIQLVGQISSRLRPQQGVAPR